MADWLSIETAPRDGACIILYWPNQAYDADEPIGEVISIGWWTTNSRFSRKYSDGTRRLSAADEMWLDGLGVSDSYFTDTTEMDCPGMAQIKYAPTHWMPLPSVPTALKDT
jgi:hypothetical protein